MRLRLLRTRKPEIERTEVQTDELVPALWTVMQEQYGYREYYDELGRRQTTWAFMRADMSQPQRSRRLFHRGIVTARLRAHKARLLPMPENDAPTQAEPQPQFWWYEGETAREDVARLATVPVSAR